MGTISENTAKSGNPVLDQLTLDPRLLLFGAAGIAGASLVGLGAYEVVKHRRKSKSQKRKSSRSKKGKRGRAYESGSGITGTERQYKRKGGGKVKYTKKGQPYVIAADGKARFIKRS